MPRNPGVVSLDSSGCRPHCDGKSMAVPLGSAMLFVQLLQPLLLLRRLIFKAQDGSDQGSYNDVHCNGNGHCPHCLLEDGQRQNGRITIYIVGGFLHTFCVLTTRKRPFCKLDCKRAVVESGQGLGKALPNKYDRSVRHNFNF